MAKRDIPLKKIIQKGHANDGAQQSANTHSNNTTKRMKKGQGNYKVTRILLLQQQNSSTPKRVHPKHMTTETVECINYGSQ